MDSLIRLADAGDLSLLPSLMGEFYAESGYPFDLALASAALTKLIDDPNLGRLWLIQDSRRDVGYIVITFGFSLEFHGRDAFIDEFYIQPAFRGAGLGTRVLDAVEVECRALGIRAFHLEVERVNEAGQALYRRKGFQGNNRQLLTKRLSRGPLV
jgi:ribosomal protein S18 acetylase RimI-like enzyme